VKRYIHHFVSRYSKEEIPYEVIHECEDAILNLEVMPSMRALMTAGPALDRDNTAGFNCSYLPVDNPRAFDELMYILLCGTGVGFSVERQYVQKLPEVSEEIHETDTVIVVADSKIGWASSFRELISLLYAGKLPKWDMGKVRPAGARLKTFGGRASGPAPLEELFRFTVDLFQRARGRSLTSIECHDLCCKVADIVVVGGVRRSALISLSNLTDDRMRTAKSGQWWLDEPQRALSNNSVCFTEKPELRSFIKEWSSLYESRSGERGIFNRPASQSQAAASGRRESDVDFGTNPCSEIILRPNQFCNLSEVVVRSTDTLDDLKRKVELATILGTLQATQTNFRYLRRIWQRNTEEEALLGVSLTGIMDHPILNGRGISDAMYCAHFCGNEDTTLPEILKELKDVAINTNAEWADRLGINPAAAITCVKPSGTVSQLVDSASGIHPRYSPYYVRRVRCDVADPLAKWMEDQGVPCERDITKDSNVVFSFPIKAPDNASCVSDIGAMEQLRLWEIYQEHWCEHKPSVTVYYTDEDFMEVGAWVWEHFDSISGVSFLPHSDHTYQQAPYEEIDEETYRAMVDQMPVLNWDESSLFEEEDQTSASQELACTGGACEL
jgi:ribonucleoside-diphosphate reductase alpha chain